MKQNIFCHGDAALPGSFHAGAETPVTAAIEPMVLRFDKGLPQGLGHTRIAPSMCRGIDNLRG